MTDFAGPILGTVGAVVGFAVGGPSGAMWGWTIGATLGGMYSASQQVIPGPKIGEVARQTSQEGGFRPIVYGRSHPIAGNVIADGGPFIVVHRESQGKGGPKVEYESVYRTYAVGFCEGWAELLQAWRNGILVYDAEDPSMAAENAKFLEYATWYTGSFDQPASPDLEEIYGVGQAPYFRGTAYLSIHNEDVTDQRGAWSQWQVRVFRGAAKSYTSTMYPLYGIDGASLSATFAPATMTRLVTSTAGSEAATTAFSFGTATLRAPVVPLGPQPPEEIQPAMTFGTAALREALITHEQPAEEITTTFTFGEASLYEP